MWLILLTALVAGLCFLERYFHLLKAQRHASEFLAGVYTLLNRDNPIEAAKICEDIPGPVAHVVRSAILTAGEPPERISEAIHDAGMLGIRGLESKLNLLVTLVRLLPMLGLLGTVLGLMNLLNQPVTSGLWSALITTAVGLCLGIIFFAGYQFLVSRVEAVVIEMEKASSDIYAFLVNRKRRKEQDGANG